MIPKRVWVVSELYHPEQSATGYFLTKIAEGLSRYYAVNVLCAQPTYFARGTRAQAHEVLNGVNVRRCFSTVFGKDLLPLRLINNLTLTVSIATRAFFGTKKEDCVLAVTNPPILPIVLWLVCKATGSKFVLLVHDLYPEVLVITGLIKKQSCLAAILERIYRRVYVDCDTIIVLGRDAAALIGKKTAQRNHLIRIIPNWADLDDIHPLPRNNNSLLQRLGLTEKFVVQYAGNMGRTHDIETLLEAAEILKSHQEIHFLLVGWGAKRKWLEETVHRNGLQNVTFLDPVDRSDLCVMLNACDLAVVPLMRGMTGVSVPSRVYNILASGKPILAIAEPDSEVSLLVSEGSLGWVVNPHDAGATSKAIREAYDHRDDAHRIASRARNYAEKHYSYSKILAAYRDAIAMVDAG
jgi:colanic acid biosynthesis glycosyl transferase WcaI